MTGEKNYITILNLLTISSQRNVSIKINNYEFILKRFKFNEYLLNLNTRDK